MQPLYWVLTPLFGILGIKYNSYVLMPVSSGFMLYVLFGYLISTEQWRPYKRIILYLLAIAGGIFAMLFTIRTSAASGTDELAILNYQYFPSALTGAAIFVFVKHLFDKPAVSEAIARRPKLVGLIRTVSGCCMGVWLTHSLAIMLGAAIFDLSASSYVYRFALPWFVFAACVFGVWVVKKIPVLKHIV